MTAPDDKVYAQRYEAIFRALNRRSTLGVLLCSAASLVLLFAFIALVIPAGASILPRGWPDWLAFLALSVPFAGIIIVVPNLLQLLVVGGRVGRAFEAFNAFALLEKERWEATTGESPGVIWSRRHAARYLRSSPAMPAPTKVRFLTWIGRIDEAEAVLRQLPAEYAHDRFERSLLGAMLDRVHFAEADLTVARAALATIPPSPERDRARLALAFEEASQAQLAGSPWWEPLAAARDEVAWLPKGASLRDRFLASARLGVVLYAAIGLFALAARL